MKAIQFSAHGDSSVLNVVEMDIPTPGPGQVLVKMVATGINFIDIYRRRGTYPLALPHILGEEGVGVIQELGPGVTGLEVGERIAFTDGKNTYAEYAVVPADKALPVPEQMDDFVAAALPLQGMTAHYLVRSLFPVDSSHTILIHAGAGGVGQLVIQLAKMRGARVFTTVSNPEKAELALSAGADEVLSYDTFDEAARELTDGVGVDVVYDGVGQATFDRSLLALRKRGMMALFGAASGPVPAFDLQRLNSGGSLFITRPTLWDYLLIPEELSWRWTELTEAVSTGALRVSIGATFTLTDAALAHDALSGRQTTGKVLLLPSARTPFSV